MSSPDARSTGARRRGAPAPLQGAVPHRRAQAGPDLPPGNAAVARPRGHSRAPSRGAHHRPPGPPGEPWRAAQHDRPCGRPHHRALDGSHPPRLLAPSAPGLAGLAQGARCRARRPPHGHGQSGPRRRRGPGGPLATPPLPRSGTPGRDAGAARRGQGWPTAPATPLRRRLTPLVETSWTSPQEHACSWPVYGRETVGYRLNSCPVPKRCSMASRSRRRNRPCSSAAVVA